MVRRERRICKGYILVVILKGLTSQWGCWESKPTSGFQAWWTRSMMVLFIETIAGMRKRKWLTQFLKLWVWRVSEIFLWMGYPSQEIHDWSLRETGGLDLRRYTQRSYYRSVTSEWGKGRERRRRREPWATLCSAEKAKGLGRGWEKSEIKNKASLKPRE